MGGHPRNPERRSLNERPGNSVTPHIFQIRVDKSRTAPYYGVMRNETTKPNTVETPICQLCGADVVIAATGASQRETCDACILSITRHASRRRGGRR